MEITKTLDQVTVADPRSAMFAIVNRTTGASRPIKLEDHHRRFASVTLNKSVPEEVKSAFAVAANLYVYSWFVYAFGSVAELQCLATLEFALRIRSGDRKNGPGLKKYLRDAIAKNWLIDEGLPDPVAIPVVKLVDGQILVVPPEAPSAEIDPQARVRHLSNSLPNWRNVIAHGSSMLFPPGNYMLVLVAALINQLWPARSNAD